LPLPTLPTLDAANTRTSEDLAQKKPTLLFFFNPEYEMSAGTHDEDDDDDEGVAA